MAHLFWKLLRSDMRHYDMEYKEGRNEARKFTEHPRTGIHFSHINDIPYWLARIDDVKWVTRIYLLPESHVRSGWKKYRTDCCVLKGKIPLADFLFIFYSDFYLIECNPWNIQFITGKENIVIQEDVIHHDPHALQFIKNQTWKLCEMACKMNGLVIQYCMYKPPEVCEAAVRQNGLALAWVNQKTPAICEAAVRQNGWAIQFVPKEMCTEELYELAVERDGNVLAVVPKEVQTAWICHKAILATRSAIHHVATRFKTNFLQNRRGAEQLLRTGILMLE